MVRRVKKEKYPKIVESILEPIGDLAEEALASFMKKDLKGLGDVLNINQGLLYSLGVSHEALELLVYASLRGRAYGAKLVGAGGGGCMVALCSGDSISNVATEIKRVGGTVIVTSKTNDGVRVEE